jgi:NADPH-dependent curcumin reductase
MASTNTQVCLASYPQGAVTPDNFILRQAPLPTPGAGELLVRNIYLSCDPYMRGRMSGGTGYAAGFPVGEPIPARVVGEVVHSRHPDFKVGDLVWDFLRWEQFTLVRDVSGLRRIDPARSSPVKTCLFLPPVVRWARWRASWRKRRVPG